MGGTIPFDLTIADRCRNAGLRVVEVAGWQTRGLATFNPRGSVNHHTAGPATGRVPSLGGIVNGFHGSAPPPLANAMQSREPDGNDIFYIVAAGKANHAGRGGWRGLSGNSSVAGLEIEHTGREPLPESRQRLAARFHAAMAKDRYSASMVCQHFEWAPGRKIDAATGVDGNRFRNYVVEYLHGTPAPTPPPVANVWEGEMFGVKDTDGGIYLAGPGIWKHLNGDEWGAWERFLPPLAAPVNAVQRDWIKADCLSIVVNTA